MDDHSRRVHPYLSNILAILASSFGTGLVFGFQPPLIGLILERQGMSSLGIGAVIGISMITIIVLAPMYPRVIGWTGLRGAMLLGVAVKAAILCLMPIFTGVGSWMFLRIITGWALGLEWIASETWLNFVTTQKTRGVLMGVDSTLVSAGLMCGPLLLRLTGTHDRTPFYVGALVLAISALPLLIVSTPVSNIQPRRRPPLVRIARISPAAMLAALIAGLLESADIALLPVFATRSGLSERDTLSLVAVFLAGNVSLQLMIGALADWLGRRPLLLICALANIIAPLLLPAALQSQWQLWTLLFLWGGLLYGFYTLGMAILGDEYEPCDLSQASTAFVVAYCLGGLVGPASGGLALDLWKRAGLLAFQSGAALLLTAALTANLLGHFRSQRTGSIPNGDRT